MFSFFQIFTVQVILYVLTPFYPCTSNYSHQNTQSHTHLHTNHFLMRSEQYTQRQKDIQMSVLNRTRFYLIFAIDMCTSKSLSLSYIPSYMYRHVSVLQILLKNINATWEWDSRDLHCKQGVFSQKQRYFLKIKEQIALSRIQL